MSQYFTLCPVSAYDKLTNESSKRSFKEDNRQTYEHSPSVDTDKLGTSLDSETSHSSPSTARPKMKRKQRTMFSPLEVWELERVFAQRRYLMPEDVRRRIGTKTWSHCKERRGKIYLLNFLDTVLKAFALCRLICLPKRFSNIYLCTYTAVSEKVIEKKSIKVQTKTPKGIGGSS